MYPSFSIFSEQMQQKSYDILDPLSINGEISYESHPKTNEEKKKDIFSPKDDLNENENIQMNEKQEIMNINDSCKENEEKQLQIEILMKNITENTYALSLLYEECDNEKIAKEDLKLLRLIENDYRDISCLNERITSALKGNGNLAPIHMLPLIEKIIENASKKIDNITNEKLKNLLKKNSEKMK